MPRPTAPMQSPTGAMADAMGELLHAGYRLVGLALIPAVPLFLSRRARQGKEDPSRRNERYGRAVRDRPPGRLVWVHAASVGETNAVMPLIGRITAAGMSVLLTTVTATSAKVAAARLPQGAFHQFAPIDISPFIGRFLAHWRPDLALFVESELWPTTMQRLTKAHVPQILVNAKLSNRSFERWQRIGWAARSLFRRITLCLAQSETDGERYRALGVRAVEVIGNLKFDVPPPPVSDEALVAFRDAAGTRPLWVAASTHEGEEEIIAASHALLAGRYPDLMTVIVPRHPDRGGAIAEKLAAMGQTVARRSLGEVPNAGTGIYLADTLGELGLFYSAAPVAFVGGSLAPPGGHNPIEPVKLDTAVLHGPLIQNFAEIYGVLDRAVPTEPIVDAGSLAEVLGALLDDPVEIRRRVDLAAKALSTYCGALDATMAALAPYLTPDGARPAGIARS